MSLKMFTSFHLYTISYLILKNCKCDQSMLLTDQGKDDYCGPPPVDIKFERRNALILIADNNSDIYLENCIFAKRSVGRAIMILRDNKRLYKIPRKSIVKVINHNPTIIVIYHDLDPNFIYHSNTKSIFKSHQLSVYILITTRNTKYKCEKGVFSDEAFTRIDQFLNAIWHKFLILIVLVEFPFVCPGYYVTYSNKRLTERDLYDRTITSIRANSIELPKKLMKETYNLTKDFPLRANIFQRFPTSIDECENMHYYLKVDEKYTNKMCGMDAFVMHDVLRHYQFNVTYPILDDVDGYGFKYKNSVTGSLGQLLRGEFDISFNSRFIIQYLEEDKINFLHYVSFDSICAVLKTPDYRPLWYHTYQFFWPSTWCAIVAVLTVCSAANKMLEKIRKTFRHKTNSANMVHLIAIGLFGCYFNVRVKASILGGMCLLISLIIYALFQGHVNYVYTTLVRYATITSLKELHNSNIKVYASASFYNLLGTDVQAQHVVTIEKKKAADVLKGNIATLQRKSDTILEIVRYFSDESGWPMMYMVEECYGHNLLSYITKKDFPFTNEFNIYMMMLLESGLPDAYYRFTQNALRIRAATTTYKPRSLPRPSTPSNTAEFRIAFGIICVGYFVSTIALVLELWWAKRSERSVSKFIL